MDQEQNLTPMMQQYQSVKKQYKDEVLFFRLGDFYEMFDSDAVEVSRLLNLTLTGSSNRKYKMEYGPGYKCNNAAAVCSINVCFFVMETYILGIQNRYRRKVLCIVECLQY